LIVEASRHRLGPVEVERIGTADYPTATQRPTDSRLDCGKLHRIHGVVLPDWRGSVATVVARMMA
jgi:dTDP-4-dehydrorhamnose reductase